MEQDNNMSIFNPSEVYSGPMVVEYEQPLIDMELFKDTPLELNLSEELSYCNNESPSEVNCLYFKDKIFVLKNPISTEIEFEDEMWFIKNNDLGIKVWGETYESAIEAFNFTFYSTYMNFGLEEDANLSASGVEMKDKLNDLILFFNEG